VTSCPTAFIGGLWLFAKLANDPDLLDDLWAHTRMLLDFHHRPGACWTDGDRRCCGCQKSAYETTDRVEPRVDCYRIGALTDAFVHQATTKSQTIHARMRT
jgi:hypothetical protein